MKRSGGNEVERTGKAEIEKIIIISWQQANMQGYVLTLLQADEREPIDSFGVSTDGTLMMCLRCTAKSFRC